MCGLTVNVSEFIYICYLDFEIKETAVFIGSSGGLQVELGAASWLGKLGRFKYIVMIDADESVLKLDVCIYKYIYIINLIFDMF